MEAFCAWGPVRETPWQMGTTLDGQTYTQMERLIDKQLDTQMHRNIDG